MTILLFQVILSGLLGGFLGIRLLPLSGPGRHSLALGLGWLFALLFIGSVMWLLLVAFNLISPWLPLAGLAFLVLIVEFFGRFGVVSLQPVGRIRSVPVEHMSRGQVIAVVALGVLIGVRLLSLLPDVLLRPLFAWDAWTVWGFEARVWFETGEYVSFLPRAEWLSAPPEAFIRDGLIAYPHMVPALILWAAGGAESWTGVGPGLLWLTAAGLAGLIIFGALRQADLPLPWALGAAYALLSIPILNAHVALYGYADLWIAAVIAAFAALLLQAERQRRRSWCFLAGLALLPLPLVKEEGVYWLLCGALALLSLWTGLGVRRLAAVLGLGIVLAVAANMLGFDPAEWITRGRLSLSFELMLSALAGAARHAFFWIDWHLFGFLSLLALGAALLKPTLANSARGLLAFSLLGLVLIWLVAPMTGAGSFVTIGTLFSRLLLQLAPALVLFCAMIFYQFSLAIAEQNPCSSRAG